MKYSQVRDLARRYATGKLSQESYRSQRRALIDSITGGGVQLSYRNDELRSPRSRSHTRLIAIAATVLTVVILGAIVLVKRPGRGHGAAEAVATAPVAAPVDPGPDLVRTFMDADDWTDTSLQAFERRWQDLGAEQQGKARTSSTYPRLVNEVRRQVISEKAIAGSGGVDAHLMELQKLAKTLGATAP